MTWYVLDRRASLSAGIEACLAEQDEQWQLRIFQLEKWFDIQSFTNVIAAMFWLQRPVFFYIKIGKVAGMF